MITNTLTPSQTRAIKLIKDACLKNDSLEQYDLYEITEEEIKATDYGTVWLKLQIERTGDCEKYSPRWLLTRTRRLISIGKRGGIMRHSFSQGTTSFNKVVRGLFNTVHQ